MAGDDDENGTPSLGHDSKRRSVIERHERVSNERALVELVVALERMKPKQRDLLGVPEPVLDALNDAAQIRSAPALERQRKFTRGLLRGTDWPALARKVDLVRAGFEAEESKLSQIGASWAHELVVQGDVALHRFLEHFPEGDRRRLRQLLQNVIRAPEARRAKARNALEQAVEGVVRAAGQGAPPLVEEPADEAAGEDES